MINKLDRMLDRLKQNHRHGLMAHIVIGYPDLSASEKIILALADAGADLIEMQIPFTDPLADAGYEVLRVACIRRGSLERRVYVAEVKPGVR